MLRSWGSRRDAYPLFQFQTCRWWCCMKESEYLIFPSQRWRNRFLSSPLKNQCSSCWSCDQIPAWKRYSKYNSRVQRSARAEEPDRMQGHFLYISSGAYTISDLEEEQIFDPEYAVSCLFPTFRKGMLNKLSKTSCRCFPRSYGSRMDFTLRKGS